MCNPSVRRACLSAWATKRPQLAEADVRAQERGSRFDPLRPCASLDLRTAKCIFRESAFPILIHVVPSLRKAMRRRDFITGIAGSAATWRDFKQGHASE